MRLSSGFFRSLFADSWTLEHRDTGILLWRKTPIAISYLDLDRVQIKPGPLSDSLVFKTKTETHQISGIKAESAVEFKKQTEVFCGDALAKEVHKAKKRLAASYKRFKTLAEGDFYLNQSKIAEVRANLPSQVKYFEHTYFDPQRLDSSLRSFFDAYKAFSDPNSPGARARNKKYVAAKKKEYRKLFDTLGDFPLTDEQREAIVTEEDNVLLVAAAGAGKSSTLVGKVLYLLKEGQYKPGEIIAFAFNRSASAELSEKLETLYEQFPETGAAVRASTFHGFCFDVLAEVTKEKPTIANIATASKSAQLRFINGLIQNLIQEDTSFGLAFAKYFALFKHPSPREGEIQNQQDYNKYLESLKGKRRYDQKTKTWDVRLTAINGVEVKSKEELQLANWLFLNGVTFEYEKPFNVTTADETHRQYFPDFYYPDADLWHEHFALDANGRAPSHMANYESGVEWKRAINAQHETNFIETKSAQFSDGSVFASLQDDLESFGIAFSPLSAKEVDEVIRKVFNPERDTELLITFLKHFKTNGLALEKLDEVARSAVDSERTRAFIKVFKPIYTAYEKDLSKGNCIDFEDLIHQAAEALELGRYKSPFKYVLIDEFQDASQDRLRLIKALRNQHQHSRILAVGDDWQSIYRFTGSDLGVMTGFEEIFGYTKRLQLTETFRSYQELVEVASTFIMKNPRQFQKHVKAPKSWGGPCIIMEPFPDNRPDDALLSLCKKISGRARDKETQVKVLILTRYIAQKPTILAVLGALSPFVEFSWMTIHASKGLEADYVILHHFDNGFLSFPNEITDDPLLELVIPEPEGYPFAEERRLLYVALTRAKRAAFCLYNETTPSVFLYELKDEKWVYIRDPRFQPKPVEGDHCPQCRQGRLRLMLGEASAMLICSNPKTCTHSSPLSCPECEIGSMVKRTNKSTGENFYACNQFPRCRYVLRRRESANLHLL